MNEQQKNEQNTTEQETDLMNKKKMNYPPDKDRWVSVTPGATS